MIWDSGLYTTKEGLTTKKAIEAKVKAGLKKGELELVFIGKKIKGGFVLVQTHFSESSDTWLMIKKNDEYAK